MGKTNGFLIFRHNLTQELHSGFIAYVGKKSASVEMYFLLHHVKNWNWFNDERLNGVLNHQSRKHMDSDLQRYLYCSIYAQRFNEAPKLENFPEALLPNHKNAKQGIFSDRFRVQLKNQPATTITSHISKDGHYYIHPDPLQARSLTPREAARLQGFPDRVEKHFIKNKISQTSSYQIIGNSVPVPLAYAVISNFLKYFI